jgi:ADP-heptose:LPS heptosyltransferase
MIKLPRVTLACVDTYNFGSAVTAIKKSMEQCEFAAVKFLTDIPIKVEGVEVVQIPTISTKAEYSRFIIKELYKYFDTDFVLLIQHDGYVICGDAWTDEFLEYDFIGAPWLYTDGRNVGNGGVSVRSKRLQQTLGDNNDIDVFDPEDEIIGRLYRRLLEQNGFKFPSEELADRFSFELRTPIQPTFAFHGNFHKPYQKTVVVTRKASLGDVVAAQPVLEYYHNKGYRVVLNTLPQFLNLFVQHPFPVWYIENVDKRLLANAKQINLDMAYEAFPEKNHLQAYYDVSGITDAPLVKPKLTLSFNPKLPENKLFKKYAIIHIDKRGQPGRNIQGNIEWWRIAGELKEQGYEVVQIGKGEHVQIPMTIQMNAPSEPFLMWLIGGSDLFVGIDSGPSNIAVAMGVKSAIFFGAVDAKKIHPDLTDIEVIEYENCCPLPKCWHSTISVEGVPCIVDKDTPPCVQYTTEQVFNAINKLING